MGFIVMDEAFDIWKKRRRSLTITSTGMNGTNAIWKTWLRDRNHASVIIWSIGNEVAEQWGSHPEAGIISKELVSIVKNLDQTRPITAACNFVSTDNTLITAGNLDLVGTNYAHARDVQISPDVSQPSFDLHGDNFSPRHSRELRHAFRQD
jgi:beta-galactosidase